MLRGVHDERAPSASDVEKSLALAKAELATHKIELGFLRIVERIARMFEVRARIHHAVVEPETIEVVADVVVILNRRAVSRRIVARTFGFHSFVGAPFTNVDRKAIVARKSDQIARERREDGRAPQ